VRRAELLGAAAARAAELLGLAFEVRGFIIRIYIVTLW
jgi:hypothetical protein